MSSSRAINFSTVVKLGRKKAPYGAGVGVRSCEELPDVVVPDAEQRLRRRDFPTSEAFAKAQADRSARMEERRAALEKIRGRGRKRVDNRDRSDRKQPNRTYPKRQHERDTKKRMSELRKQEREEFTAELKAQQAAARRERQEEKEREKAALMARVAALGAAQAERDKAKREREREQEAARQEVEPIVSAMCHRCAFLRSGRSEADADTAGLHCKCMVCGEFVVDCACELPPQIPWEATFRGRPKSTLWEGPSNETRPWDLADDFATGLLRPWNAAWYRLLLGTDPPPTARLNGGCPHYWAALSIQKEARRHACQRDGIRWEDSEIPFDTWMNVKYDGDGPFVRSMHVDDTGRLVFVTGY